MKMKRIFSLLTAVLMALCFCCAGVTVSAADGSVSLPYKAVTVTKGKSVTLKATVTGGTLQWSSSDTSVVKVNSSGRVTAVDNGTADVTATIKGTDKSASVKVTVGKRVEKITVNKTEVSLKPGDSFKPSIKISPSDASNKSVSISVSDKSVVKTDSKGSITAVKAGTASVTIKAADGSGKKAVITVKVSENADSSATDSSATDSTSTVAKPQSTEKTSGAFNKDITSIELAQKIKVGWNLGNSLDSCTGGSGLGLETAWGNPKTTKAMIDDIKAMGFNAVRIPVTWGLHCDDAGTVDSAWMKRVKEVVDYAYDNGMYVILNSHHDNEYYRIGECIKSEDTYKVYEKKMTVLWTQIANTFKGYSERLIFETLNEPRTEGSAKEWVGGTPEERKVVENLNAAIVGAIRATGGNNAYRHIMVPAYAATSTMSVLRNMKIPDDDRVIVSVHAYSPYNFAMNAGGSSDFSDSDKRELDNFFSDLNKYFVSKGRAVIIGECGCINKGNEEDRLEWVDYYIKGAKAYGIPCFWWDNNSNPGQTGEETFGIYNRRKGEWGEENIAKALAAAGK
ncbi:MAG: cellulase family glycosylhydrolase [Ruminococcus sp.]|nr:cellulase family glycosylhydrolase [Ruminococcus sp.]